MEQIRTALSAGTGQSNTNVILRNVLKEDMFIIRRGFSGARLPSLPLQGTPLDFFCIAEHRVCWEFCSCCLSEWSGLWVRRRTGWGVGWVTAIVLRPPRIVLALWLKAKHEESDLAVVWAWLICLYPTFCACLDFCVGPPSQPIPPSR